MDHKAKAKAAWQRSLEVVRSSLHSNRGTELDDQNPSEWAAQLLLGLESINASKTGNQTEQERAQAFLIGNKYIEKAFNANQKSAAAANALCELFLRKNNFKRASVHLGTCISNLSDMHSGIEIGRANDTVCGHAHASHGGQFESCTGPACRGAHQRSDEILHDRDRGSAETHPWGYWYGANANAQR